MIIPLLHLTGFGGAAFIGCSLARLGLPLTLPAIPGFPGMRSGGSYRCY